MGRKDTRAFASGGLVDGEGLRLPGALPSASSVRGTRTSLLVGLVFAETLLFALATLSGNIPEGGLTLFRALLIL